MKLLPIPALILSASSPAFADHTAFVPKPAAAPAVTEFKSSNRAPSLYPPYTRNALGIVRAEPANQPDASSRHASRYPAYSRSNPHFQAASSLAVFAVGATSQKRTDVSDK